VICNRVNIYTLHNNIYKCKTKLEIRELSKNDMCFNFYTASKSTVMNKQQWQVWQLCLHRWGTAFMWRWGLWSSKILQIPLFKNPKGRGLLRDPQFGPQNPACGGSKISGNPVHSVCSQGILVVPLLASILRSWHRGSWN